MLATTTSAPSSAHRLAQLPANLVATVIGLAIRIVKVKVPQWQPQGEEAEDLRVDIINLMCAPTASVPDGYLIRVVRNVTDPLAASQLPGPSARRALDLLQQVPGYFIESTPGWNEIALRASALGRVDSLQWWLERHLAVPSTRAFPPYCWRVLVEASRNGHVAVLDWWLANRPFPPLPVDVANLVQVAQDAHAAALEAETHAHAAMETAPFVAATQALIATAVETHGIAGDALAQAEHAERVAGEAIDAASANNHVSVLAWWHAHSRSTVPDNVRVPFMYTARAVDDASARGATRSLTWWWQRATDNNPQALIPLKHTPRTKAWARQHWPRDTWVWWGAQGHKAAMPNWLD